METDKSDEDIGRYSLIHSNNYHININRTPQEAFNNYQDYVLGKCNFENKKMKERVVKNEEKFEVGALVRVCQKENIEKEYRSRFIRIGAVIHTEKDRFCIVKMMDTGK
ncbi:hypothetical protein BDAP_002383 [Binucleata daphniae]